MGIRPTLKGVLIDPCIPSDWNSVKIKRFFRNCILNIQIKNPENISKGVSYLRYNGKTVKGNFIPIEDLQGIDNLDIYAEMGVD